MKRYQKLIKTAADDMGYFPLARAIGVPASSLNDWVVNQKEPRLASLKKIGKYFQLPVPLLLMEIGARPTQDDRLVDAMFSLNNDQKKQVVEYIKTLRGEA